MQVFSFHSIRQNKNNILTFFTTGEMLAGLVLKKMFKAQLTLCLKHLLSFGIVGVLPVIPLDKVVGGKHQQRRE